MAIAGDLNWFLSEIVPPPHTVMRDETEDVDRRDEMARAAAPYVHPKLAATAHSGELDGRLTVSLSVRLKRALKRAAEAKAER